jgi:glutathione S-transferase
MELTLYFSPGACSRVPLIALEELGRPFEARLVAFMKGEHKSPDYLALNPAGKIPTLVADGRPIAQNLAIQTFLARSFPEARLLPFTGEPLADALILSQLAWFSADLHPLVTRIRLPFFACDAAPERVKEQASEAMAGQLAPLDQRLSAQPWVLGQEWSSIDAYLYWVWFRITGAGFDPSAFPNIAAHSARMDHRPAVQRAIAREKEAEAELEAQGLALKFPPAGGR